MKLLMISGDRSILQGKKGAFFYTLEEMCRHWERIDVVCPHPLSTTHSPFPNVFFHPSPYHLWRQPKWILEKGKELIAEHHHDVMTAHDYPPFYNGIGASRLHQVTKVPYALEIHHIVGWPESDTFTEYLGWVSSRWQIPKNARCAAGVRVVNTAVKNELAQWGIPDAKIHIVPSFYLDTEKLRPDPSIQKQYDVVFCGRLVENKGLKRVIRAVGALPGVTLLIIGDGPEREHAEAMVRAIGMTERVMFRGWLPTQEDVIVAMQSAKIFVMNSTSEGGPRVALEAMALGMPVIVTRVGVMPEVVQDEINGIFSDGTAQGVQGEIQMLLEDENMRSRIGREATKIIERFERKKLIAGYADFLKTPCVS